MKNAIPKPLVYITLILFSLCLYQANAQVAVGSGSYTNTFPGTDQAGRNAFPSGSPQVSGSAVGRPIPTNDWWSKLVKEDHADNMFNYPLALKSINKGLIVSYIPWGVYGDLQAVLVGTQGLNASQATIADHSDWTVTMDWNDGTHGLQATTGIGMPFTYFTKKSGDVAEVTINEGTVTVLGDMIIVENSRYGSDFAVYGPAGTSWSQNGKVFTSTLNNKDYFSVALLPQGNTDVRAAAEDLKQFAFVFPTDTKTEWSYNQGNGEVTTNFSVTSERKEGSGNSVLMGLLPHQWGNLAPGSAQPNKGSYTSVRGELKMLAGNSFSVRNTFKGILPTMPYLANYSDGFNPAELDEKIKQIENDGLAAWTDSYNEGQVMNRLIQTARIADQMGNTAARDKMIATVKDRLENWLSYQAGEKAFLFYYNDTWSALLGYPSGHGQDNNINDHHFHWGYFIHAAAFMEQFEPGWADQWGGMVNKLVDDAANRDRDGDQFPFLRNFSPYAGHCWANGFASFPQGNDQESTSESMQFNSSLIHWGTITGNQAIKDLGVYLYTTEQTAIEEYWFDQNDRTFKPDQQYGMVSRVWGNSYDNGTFWTSDITASYVIELYPMHGGSLYLGHDKEYVGQIWSELQANTGILDPNDTNPNLWHDTIWKYLSLIDPARAIELYNQNLDRGLKFGVSDAQTYHWLHSANAMGTLNSGITADYPITAVFEQSGERTYVAHNYGNAERTVTFSDGYRLQVPANQMATNRDTNVSGTISSNVKQVRKGGSIDLSVTASGDVSRVQFFDGDRLIGEDASAPYAVTASNLDAAIHGMYAKVFNGDAFNVTNIISVQVGDQVPYNGSPIALPGTIEPGFYDAFEGGVGQNVSYIDVDRFNQGEYRPDEYVDAALDDNEGATLGWTSPGEWLEYTVNVQTAGSYALDMRYASGNDAGGGPIHFEIDGRRVSPDISVASTGDWGNWDTSRTEGINLPAGEVVLRLVIGDGGFNIGKLSFTLNGVAQDNPPTANAGQDISVTASVAEVTLDGSSSNDSDGDALTYAWEQVNGPNSATISDAAAVGPTVSDLQIGVYEFRLTVSDAKNSVSDTMSLTIVEDNNDDGTDDDDTDDDTSGDDGDTCSVEATASQQGTFSTGYTSSFKTVGNDVIATFEILDTDREGLVAFLWKASPFTEYQMTQVSDKVFTHTLRNQSPGSTIRYACKFAFAGGLAVTEYIDYVVGTPCPGADVNPDFGDGLTARYYNGMNFENFVLERIDRNIDFNWNNGSPGEGVGNDDYSARWTGDIMAENSGEYTFYLNTDNGRRLWIGEQLLIDEWVDNWAVEYQGTIYLEAGQKYPIKLEYFENWGGANAKLEWEGPGTPRAVVPTSALYSNGSGTAFASLPAQGITIYPNPASSIINVSSDIPVNAIRVMNVQGQTVATLSNGDTTIDVTNLAPGYYVMEISVIGGVVTKNFIKQ